MKTLQLQTEKATIILMQLPEGAIFKDLIDWEGKNVIWYQMPMIRGLSTFELPQDLPTGAWQILGLLDSLSEEQKASICDNEKYNGYKNYVLEDFIEYFAADSFKSLLESYNVTRVNAETPYFKVIRSGTGRNNGFEGDRGKIVHLVGDNCFPNWQTALCGIKPKGNGWYYVNKESETTCEKCSKRSEAWQSAEALTFNNPLVLFCGK